MNASEMVKVLEMAIERHGDHPVKDVQEDDISAVSFEPQWGSLGYPGDGEPAFTLEG